MRTTAYKKTFHTESEGWRHRWLLPGFFLILSFLLMILPMEGVVASIKTVLSYIFIPQVRASHGVVQYVRGTSRTVQELLQAHHENQQLKQQIETTQLLAAQAKEVFAENERLSGLLQIAASRPWKGVWAKVAYREPTQWNSVVIDKGTMDGIVPRSAVIAMAGGQEGLAGVVVEATENTAQVLLVRDEEFSAAVQLERGGETGLLTGAGMRPVQIKYVPLLTEVKKGDKVYTSSMSSVFPAGILVGEVSNVRPEESFQTALTLEVLPQVRSASVKEVFVILSSQDD